MPPEKQTGGKAIQYRAENEEKKSLEHAQESGSSTAAQDLLNPGFNQTYHAQAIAPLDTMTGRKVSKRRFSADSINAIAEIRDLQMVAQDQEEYIDACKELDTAACTGNEFIDILGEPGSKLTGVVNAGCKNASTAAEAEYDSAVTVAEILESTTNDGIIYTNPDETELDGGKDESGRDNISSLYWPHLDQKDIETELDAISVETEQGVLGESTELDGLNEEVDPETTTSKSATITSVKKANDQTFIDNINQGLFEQVSLLEKVEKEPSTDKGFSRTVEDKPGDAAEQGHELMYGANEDAVKDNAEEAEVNDAAKKCEAGNAVDEEKLCAAVGTFGDFMMEDAMEEAAMKDSIVEAFMDKSANTVKKAVMDTFVHTIGITVDHTEEEGTFKNALIAFKEAVISQRAKDRPNGAGLIRDIKGLSGVTANEEHHAVDGEEKGWGHRNDHAFWKGWCTGKDTAIMRDHLTGQPLEVPPKEIEETLFPSLDVRTGLKKLDDGWSEPSCGRNGRHHMAELWMQYWFNGTKQTGDPISPHELSLTNEEWCANQRKTDNLTFRQSFGFDPLPDKSAK